jgi:hypothetical protein
MRRLLAVCAAGLLLSGCGVLDDEGPALSQPLDPAVYGPAQPAPGVQVEVPIPRLVPPTGAVARALDDGEIGVVDFGGTAHVEPEALDTASDVRVERMRWSEWGADGATGSGEIQVQTCDPTCAGGATEVAPVQVTLSGVKTCDGRRYFDHGEVRLDAGTAPATYVRAPC